MTGHRPVVVTDHLSKSYGPVSALDALTRITMQDLLLRLFDQHGFGVLLVTHDVEEAAYLAGRVIVLSAANGRAVLATLDLAVEGVGAGWFDAIVTAPLEKSPPAKLALTVCSKSTARVAVLARTRSRKPGACCSIIVIAVCVMSTSLP